MLPQEERRALPPLAAHFVLKILILTQRQESALLNVTLKMVASSRDECVTTATQPVSLKIKVQVSVWTNVLILAYLKRALNLHSTLLNIATPPSFSQQK